MKAMVIAVALAVLAALVGCTTTPKDMQAGDRPEQVFKSVLAPRAAANCIARNQMAAGDATVTVLEAGDNAYEVAAQSRSIFFTTTPFYAKVSSADKGSVIQFWAGSPIQEVAAERTKKVTAGCL